MEAFRDKGINMAQYQIVKKWRNRELQKSRVWDFLCPAIEVMTFLALVNYLASLLYGALETSEASIYTRIWPCLFFVAKLSDRFSQLTDHILHLIVYIFGRDLPCPALQFEGYSMPAVDLIITACGESHDVVLDTVTAACCIDYPMDQLRIIVADDLADSSLERKILSRGKKHQNVLYYSRRKLGAQTSGFKAGNLNSAVKFLGDTLAPWIAVLDADMIPERGILRALLAHATCRDDIAMAALPQHFYNIPVDDMLHQNMLPHAECDEVRRARLQASWCPGSGFVLRREALLGLGGFPEATIAEDHLFSWLLQGQGWQIAYVNESLQWGLQPDSFSGHIKQRTKWCVGHLHNSLLVKFGFSSRLKDTSIGQRMACFIYCIKTWASVICTPLAWTLITLCLMSGSAFVTPFSLEAQLLTIRSFLVYWLLNRVYEVTSSLLYGYRTRRRDFESNIWLSWYLAKAAFVEFLPFSFRGPGLEFTPTGTVKSVIKERDAALRPSMLERITVLHNESGILYLPILFLGLLLSASVSVWANWNTPSSMNISTEKSPPSQSAVMSLFNSCLFPGLGFEQLPAFLVPLWYAVFPPTDPMRHELMFCESPDVWRPRKESKTQRWTSAIWLLELPHLIVTVWSIWACWSMLAAS